MALTEQEKQEWLAVLDRTGAHREAGKTQKVIPESYAYYQELVERKEIILEVPAVGVPVTCYITCAKDKMENCPVHVNFHGGGFVFLQDQDDDLYCAHMAAKIHGIVVDVDYASSKDHPYPVAFEQSYEVVQWVFSQCEVWGADSKRVSMGGHSAGGCLSAAIALRAAKTGDFQVCLQVLDYAANDNYEPVGNPDPRSERSKAFSMLYADGDENLLKDPYVSPVFSDDEMLKNQPRTLIIGAENCPFCQVNEVYGIRLAAAGNEVVIKRFPNCRHGFTVRMVDAWQEAQELIIREIVHAG